ncbi:MAG TPA: hypothetical protein PLA50_01275, partial [Bacteroidia bacterium]|nr:hypothetical protein [Bacteroidia bacterium]
AVGAWKISFHASLAKPLSCQRRGNGLKVAFNDFIGQMKFAHGNGNEDRMDLLDSRQLKA